MSDSLLAHRSRFPILERSTYLVSNSLGAMPASARESLDRYADTWGERGVRAWAEQWWELPRRVGDAIGSLIGAGPGEVAMELNVTTATATVLSCFDWSERRNGVVVTDLNFPSLRYLYEGHREAGLRLQEVRSPDGIRVDTEQVIDAIDDTTRLVAVDHVLFRSAYLQDARAIAEAAHERGALVLLDAFQSVGTVPVDVGELGVDFVTGGALKWLCGGPGACYLWVRPELCRSLQPRIRGWAAHDDPFSFDPFEMKWRDDASRFEAGTANVPGLMAALPGIEIIAEVGVEAIRRRSREQTARLVELARERGFGVNAPEDPDRRGGTIAIDVPHGRAACQELLARDVIVDYRPEAGIRVSPHFYNTDEELEHCVTQLAEILESGAHEKHLEGQPKYG